VDVDGDGRMEIARAAQGQRRIDWLDVDLSGRLVARGYADLAEDPTFSGVNEILACDVDADGRRELIVRSTEDGRARVTVLDLAEGGGAETRFSRHEPAQALVAAADLAGDGACDVLVSDLGGGTDLIAGRPGQGLDVPVPVFMPHTGIIQSLASMGEDAPIVLVRDQERVYWAAGARLGEGISAWQESEDASSWRSAFVGRFTDDSIPDVLGVDERGYWLWPAADEDDAQMLDDEPVENFVVEGGLTGDLNGDGRTDLVFDVPEVSGLGGFSFVARDRHAGMAQRFAMFPTMVRPVGVVLADLNGDGAADWIEPDGRGLLVRYGQLSIGARAAR
jgi:hypothetical protein